MRTGFIGGYDEATLDFAKKAGFEGLEIFTGPACELFNEDVARRVKNKFDERNLVVTSFFHFEDYCSGDASRDAAAIENFRKTIELCEIFDVKIVTNNAFAGKVDEAQQLRNFERVFTELAKIAEDAGKLVGIENCPHHGANVAYSPAMWRKMFGLVPPVIGLEYDPSHLHWMGIDYLQPIYEFKDRIYMFHAKDTEIFPDVLKVTGVYGSGWWRYRLPGWGEINWKKIFTALFETGYSGNMVIEHEDPVYDGPLRNRGLEMGLAHLKSCY